jgi:drug/metabolite transporter (DMT)-like permease
VLGVFFALFAAIGFSAKAILIKLAYLEHVDAITLLALRMVFAVPFFVFVAIWIKRRDAEALGKKDWIVVLVLGLLGYYLSSFLDFLGLLYVTAGLERLILFLYPTLTVILSALIYKRPIGRKVLAALALSYAGIVLVFFHDIGLSENNTALNRADVILGSLLVFGSALSYSSYLVGAGHSIARIGATRFTAYASIVASIASILQFLATHPLTSLQVSVKAYELSVAMALFSTVLPVFLLSYAIHHIGPSRSSLIGSVGPVATIALAYFFLGEAVSLLQVSGTLLVLAGVVTIGLTKKKSV